MKKLIIIINPNDVDEAKKHLNTLIEGGFFILPNVFRMLIEDEELKNTTNFISYLLAGLDFNIVDFHEYIY